MASQLPAIPDPQNVLGYLATEKQYYFQHRKSRRALGIALRGLSVLSLFLAIFLPVAAPNAHEFWLIGRRTGIEAGYICALLGGFILALDQFLLISSSWGRYLLAEFKLDSLAVQTQFKLAAAQRAGGDPTAAEAEIAKILQQAHLDGRAIVETETQSWISDRDAAMAALKAAVQLQTTEIAAKLKSLREEEAKPKKGAINFIIDKPGNLAAPYSITIDGKEAAAGSSGNIPASIGLGQLDPGAATIKIVATRNGGGSFEWSETTNIVAGAATKVSVSVV